MTGLGIAILAAQVLALVGGVMSKHRRLNTTGLHKAGTVVIVFMLLAGMVNGSGLARALSPALPALSPQNHALHTSLIAPNETKAPHTPVSASTASEYGFLPVHQYPAESHPAMSESHPTQVASTGTLPEATGPNTDKAGIDALAPAAVPPDSSGPLYPSQIAGWVLFCVPFLVLPGLVWFALLLLRHRKWKHQALSLSSSFDPPDRTPGIQYRIWSGSACSFGIIHPVILLPPDASMAIKSHEEAHCQLSHAFWNSLEQILACMFWFNPCMQIMNRQGRMARELEADAHAAGYTGVTEYVRVLVQEAQKTPPSPIDSAVQNTSALAGTWESGLLERVRALAQPLRLAGPAIPAALACLAAGLGIACCALPLPPAPAAYRFEPGPAAVVAADSIAVILPWGTTYNPLLDETVTNNGVDIMVPGYRESGFDLDSLSGSVLAWADGTVSSTVIASSSSALQDEESRKKGTSITIDHGNGYTSTYAHLADCAVQAGQRVTKGQVIGTMGDTGYVSGPRLHFELLKDGLPLDPAPWIQALDSGAPTPQGTTVTRAIRVPVIQAPTVQVIQPFGNNKNQLTGKPFLHRMIILSAWGQYHGDSGQWDPLDQAPAVLAFSFGEVVNVGMDTLNGKTVTIRHGIFTSHYENLETLSVSLGQRVNRGDVLGTLGTDLFNRTRRTMNFKLSLNGVPVDPTPWVECDSPTLDLPGLTQGIPIVNAPATIMSLGFGTNQDPFTGTPRFHNGIDACSYEALDPATGESRPASAPEILAFAAGTVVKTGTDRRADIGLYVDIEHPNGYTSRYAHLERVDARPGMAVQQGQAIGIMGSTGLSTGRHLHFELQHHGIPLDPSPWLQLKLF